MMNSFASDWRDDAGSVAKKLKYTLMNEKTLQDVVVVAGRGSNETKIMAHSYLLFIGSQFLATLLERAKTNKEGIKEIKLHGIPPEAMNFVLKYIYTDRFGVHQEDTIDILKASLKLSIRGLATHCVAKLKKELSSANVLRIFEESAKMDIEELVQTSQKFILKNAREIFQKELFLNITNTSLCKVLAFDELEMEEISIFNSIMSWAKAECVRSDLEENSDNLRFVLKNVVPLVRFTLMSVHEFTNIVVPTNILVHQEVIDVYKYLGMTTSTAEKKTEFPSWILSSSERVKLSCMDRKTSSIFSNMSEANQTAKGENLKKQTEPTNIKKHNLLQYLILAVATILAIHLASSTTPGVFLSEQFISVTNDNLRKLFAFDLKVQSHPTDIKKDKLLHYLKNISGKKMISGLFVERTDGDSNKTVETIQKTAGVHPGILTLKMPSCLDGDTLWQSFTEEIISLWKNGHLVHITWGEEQHPLAQLDIFKTSYDNRWNDLITDDVYLNREWKKQLDIIVPYLQQLQNAGVVVICDFLPLINDINKLWGGYPGRFGSLKLYQITHDYLTQKHNLHSLLWTWSFYVNSDTTQLEEFWPGNNFVDVVSVYIWGIKQTTINFYEKLLEVVEDKPISMECVWTVPSPALLALHPRWNWFTASYRMLKDTSYNKNGNVKMTFQSVSIINKEDNEFFKILNSNK